MTAATAKVMAMISTMPGRSKPQTGELEDSLGGDGDGNTGEVDDSRGGEGDGNGTNAPTAWKSYPYLSEVDTVVVASFRA